MAESINFARIGFKGEDGMYRGVKLRAKDVVATNDESAEDHILNNDIHLTAEQAANITGAVQGDALGAPNGVATLDKNQRLNISQIPVPIQGGLNFQNTFNPSTGEDQDGQPIPAPSAGNKGWYWIASEAGSYTPPGNIDAIAFEVGDWLVSNGGRYDEIDNTTADAIARSAAASAKEEAMLLDAAYCTSPEDMASKNLRVGAIVLMAVANDADE